MATLDVTREREEIDLIVKVLCNKNLTAEERTLTVVTAYLAFDGREDRWVSSTELAERTGFPVGVVEEAMRTLSGG